MLEGISENRASCLSWMAAQCGDLGENLFSNDICPADIASEVAMAQAEYTIPAAPTMAASLHYVHEAGEIGERFLRRHTNVLDASEPRPLTPVLFSITGTVGPKDRTPRHLAFAMVTIFNVGTSYAPPIGSYLNVCSRVHGTGCTGHARQASGRSKAGHRRWRCRRPQECGGALDQMRLQP